MPVTAAASTPPATDRPVLIAIVHWNTPDLLTDCLRSLAQLDGAGFDVLVIDNHSARAPHPPDPTSDLSVELCRLPENRGFAGALTEAWRRARTGNYAAIWVLNADVVVAPSALTELRSAASRNPDAILGCLVMDHTGSHVDMPEKFLHPDARWKSGRRDQPLLLTDPRCLDISPIQAVHGAAWWIPAEVALRFGGPDESWFLYCEELDYCLRLGAQGVPIRLVGPARVRHRSAGSSADQPAIAAMLQFYRVRNELLLWRRFAPGWWFWILLKKAFRLAALVWSNPRAARFAALGIRDGVLGRSGKRFRPEDC